MNERQRDITPFNISSLSGAEPSPALLSPGRRGRRSSTQEKKDTPTEKPANEDPAGRPQEKRPGETSFYPLFLMFCRELPIWKVIFNQLLHSVKFIMCKKD